MKQGDQLAAAQARVHDLEAALNEHSIVAITDSKGRINYVNQKFCAISKYAKDELIGQDHRIISSGYHDKSYMRDLWQTIKSGAVWKGELCNRAKDSSLYWVATTIVPFTDAKGEIYEYVSLRTDITERKNAELALAKSEARLQSLFDTMTEGLALNEVITDTDGDMVDYRVVSVNKAFYSMADYRGSEVIGRLATDLFAVSTEEIKEFSQRHGHRTDSVTYEYTSPIRQRVFQVSCSPVVDGRFVTSFFDISEQVAAKAKLHESEAFLRNLTDHLPAYVAYWRADYTCAFANKAFADFFGRPAAEIIGMSAEELLGRDIFHKRKHIYDAVLAGEVGTNVTTVTDSAGKVVSHVATFVPDWHEGAVRGVFAVTTDVTQVSEQARQIGELTNKVISLSEAERAVISADLHDSVGQSLVLLKLQLRKELGDMLPGHADHISRWMKLIDETLKVVRDMSHRMSPIYLKSLGIVEALEDLCERVSIKAGIKIEARLGLLKGVFPDDWSIDLFRIVQEALTNVVKYANATAVSVTVTEVGERLELAIADNGRGVSPGHAEKPGLGKLLMQQRAAAFGGSVDFDSSGPGFAVRVAIPGASAK